MVDEEELAAGEFAAVELVEHVKRMKAADMEFRESGLWLVRNGSAHLRAVANRLSGLSPKCAQSGEATLLEEDRGLFRFD
jgi:hypothetical protein